MIVAVYARSLKFSLYLLTFIEDCWAGKVTHIYIDAWHHLRYKKLEGITILNHILDNHP